MIQAQNPRARKTYGLFGREAVVDMVHAKDKSGPNDRVERDVVFAEEIQVSGYGPVIINAPPAFPRVCAIGQHVGMLFDQILAHVE